MSGVFDLMNWLAKATGIACEVASSEVISLGKTTKKENGKKMGVFWFVS